MPGEESPNGSALRCPVCGRAVGWPYSVGRSARVEQIRFTHFLHRQIAGLAPDIGGGPSGELAGRFPPTQDAALHLDPGQQRANCLFVVGGQGIRNPSPRLPRPVPAQAAGIGLLLARKGRRRAGVKIGKSRRQQGRPGVKSVPSFRLESSLTSKMPPRPRPADRLMVRQQGLWCRRSRPNSCGWRDNRCSPLFSGARNDFPWFASKITRRHRGLLRRFMGSPCQGHSGPKLSLT